MTKTIDINVFRSSDWWGYKLPPLFGFAYLVIQLHGVPFNESWKLLILLFLWMIGAAGFGYYSNDVFDVHEDRIAGKENSASSHSWPFRILILLALAFITLLPWFFSKRPVVLIMTLSHLILFLLYSMPPFRMKQLGALGVLTDAVYAHLLPTAIVVIAVWPIGLTPNVDHLLLGCALLVWQTVLGVRGIIEHQVMDFDVDQKAGSTNFAQRIGLTRAFQLAENTLPKMEGVALFLFLSILLWVTPFTAGTVIAVLLLMFLSKPFGEGVLKYRPDFRAIVNRWLNQIQEMVFPLIFLAAICLHEASYFIVAAIHLIIFLPGHVQLINAGKDHVAKPIYYKGVLGAYYTGKSGVNVSFQTLVKIYANTIRPIYFAWKKLILWVYYKGFWNLYRFTKWLFYNTVVWFFYNVPYRFASWVWHLIYYAKHGHWHPEFQRRKAE
ncbi:MAG: UbiA family prenyltransferase [Flavobacteriales bacterium]|nr:UbiA family prenyltransferase [Flavobacteriales bacterium]